jgi:uncharacterized membrane protein YfcA
VSPDSLGAADLVLAALAAGLAGAVNALAGGGTLITFPTLIALGLPAVTANVTNTVALCPGYFGATVAQRSDLKGQRRHLWLVVPAGILGGVAGGLLLLNTGERTFRALVPFLILAASGLLAVQGPVRGWLSRRAPHAARMSPVWVGLPIAAAAVYGGYFGAGLSVIVLAVLGLALEDSLTRLNALKQAVALSVNVAAAACFLCSGQVAWRVAAVMAAGALAGGVAGGRLARRVPSAALRWVVVSIGLVVGSLYFLRG